MKLVSSAPRRAPARMLLFAVLCSLLTCVAVRSGQAQSFDNIEREHARTMLSQIKGDIKSNYYDATYHGMDLETRFKAADDKLKQAATLDQAFSIIAQVLLDLDDSHTVFLPPERATSVEYGVQMLMIGEKCYIAAIKPGSDAEAQGVKVGDRVHSIEGFEPTRADLWKMIYYFYSLSPRVGLNFVLQRPDGQVRQLTVKAKLKQSARILDVNRDTDVNNFIRNAEDADRLHQHLFFEAGDVVVWKMPDFEFAPEQVEDVMDKRIKKHGTLILDLRGNPGGYIVTLERLAGYFFDHDVKIADRRGRKEMKPLLAKTRGKGGFNGKLIVLVDSRSASCAEVFARLVQLEKRGVVIGDQTAGAVMQAKYYSKQTGVSTLVLFGAQITDADVIMGDGKSLEHVGVTPDELMTPTAADLAAKRDPVLARAAAAAGVTLAPEKAGALFPVEWRK